MAVSGLSAAAEIAGPSIRRLGRRDMPAVERHLLSLGPADRRKRFLVPADDDAVARYAARLDPGRAVLVGAAGADGRVFGLAEAHPAVDAPLTVEVVVSVHPYHRREGLGRRLAAQAVAMAFAEGAEAAVFLFAPENRAAAGLAGALGARVAGSGRALLTRAPSIDDAAVADLLKRAA